MKLAVEARNSFWDALKVTPEHQYNRALVAASIGSYGAYLADGSEYRYPKFQIAIMANKYFLCTLFNYIIWMC